MTQEASGEVDPGEVRSSVPVTSNVPADGPNDASGGSALSPQALRVLADFASLPLAPGREEAVAAVLGAWLPDVDALSRKMRAPEHQQLMPAAIFTHPDSDDGEA